MTASGTISVVVPTYQRRERLLALIGALERQAFSASRMEVVVSIDGSTDGTREALQGLRTAFALRTMWHPRRGRAAAVNTGIEIASGDLIVLLDDDMEPVPTCLEAHRRAHEQQTQLGVMGAVPMAIDRNARPATRYIGDKFNRHLASLALPGRQLQLTDFYSGNFSIARGLLLDVGGFDEDFKEYGNEDLELSLRLSRAGVALAYDAAACAVQHNDKTFDMLAADSVAEGRTAVLFALKHPDVVDRLKLGTFDHGPRLLRLVRDGLLRVDKRTSGPPSWLLALEAVLSGINPPGMATFYRLAFGYLYWLGARDAIGTERNAGRSTDSLSRLARDLRQ
jgi:GT2 family glycosyltransferase